MAGYCGLHTMADVLNGSSDKPALFVGSGSPAFTRGQLVALAREFAVVLRTQVGMQVADVVTIAEPNTVGGIPRTHRTPASHVKYVAICIADNQAWCADARRWSTSWLSWPRLMHAW
jgi:hypothetical protein